MILDNQMSENIIKLIENLNEDMQFDMEQFANIKVLTKKYLHYFNYESNDFSTDTWLNESQENNVYDLEKEFDKKLAKLFNLGSKYSLLIQTSTLITELAKSNFNAVNNNEADNHLQQLINKEQKLIKLNSNYIFDGQSKTTLDQPLTYNDLVDLLI